MVAAREGGGDPDANPALRLAIDKAKAASMPKDNIQRAVNKGLGIGMEGKLEDVVYEGYGPYGVAFLVSTLTDNKNRTVSELRNIFSRHNGSLGESGSTAYIFSPDPENPNFSISLDSDQKDKVVALYDELDEHDDVTAVYSNYSTA